MRYLLDLLDPELSQPATDLYPHNLAGILETAIRSFIQQSTPFQYFICLSYFPVGIDRISELYGYPAFYIRYPTGYQI